MLANTSPSTPHSLDTTAVFRNADLDAFQSKTRAERWWADTKSKISNFSLNVPLWLGTIYRLEAAFGAGLGVSMLICRSTPHHRVQLLFSDSCAGCIFSTLPSFW